MIKKLLAVTVVIAAYIVTMLVNSMYANIGGINYRYLPFPVKIISCGSSYNSYSTCTYPYIWWGIIASVTFWIIILTIAYILARKKLKK